MTTDAYILPGVTEEDLRSLAWWRKRSNRLFFLAKGVLSTAWPDKFHDFGPFQLEMCNFLEPKRNPHKKKLISVYRESLKTTCLLAFALWVFGWCNLKKEPMTINYNTATKPNAAVFMENFRFTLMNCELFQAIFDLPSDKSKYQAFTQERVSINHVQLTVSSFEEQQASRHSRIIINDDLVNELNHMTETMREQTKTKWRFQKSVSSQIKETDVSFEIDCGTPYHKLDLMWELMTTNRTYDKFIRSCVKGWPHVSIQDVLERRKPLADPKLMTYEKLLEKYDEQKKVIFATQYLLITLSEDEALAEEKHIKYWTRLPQPAWRTMVFDAGGTNPKIHDATGCTVVDFGELDGVMCMHLVYSETKFLQPVELMRYIDRMMETFKPDDARIEKEKYAATIADFFEHEFPKRNISFVKHEGRKKEDRIWKLRQWIHKGRLLFNPDPAQRTIVDRVLSFPQVELDDDLDSLAYHLDVIRPPRLTEKPLRDIPETPEFDKEYEAYLTGLSRGVAREREYYDRSY